MPFPREGLSDEVVALRLPVEADAAWIAAEVADPEVPRWTRIPSPYTKDDAFAWIALADSMAREGSAYHLVITSAADGALLGSAGLELHERPAPHGELGYWVAAPARGRGLATRAVRLLSAWGLGPLALPLLEIHVLPDNGPSRTVARKAGFARAGERLLPFRGRVEEFHVYARNAAGAAVSDRPGA
jgi:RimJ/RimL family protein N-acetyltransferase